LAFSHFKYFRRKKVSRVIKRPVEWNVKSYNDHHTTNTKEIFFNENDPQEAKQSVFRKRRKVLCACSVLFL